MAASILRSRWKFRVALALGVLVGSLVGAFAAWSFFSATDTAQANNISAGTIAQGNTPSASVSPANSPTVTITFTTVSVDGTEIPTYTLTRYPGGTAVGGSPCGAPVSGVVTCHDTPGTDGVYTYTDTPYFNNWTGTESSASNSVTIDTTPPTVSVTFPANSSNYNASGWTSGAPIAGTASDATSGIAGASSIQVTITQSSTGFTWNGSTFVSGSHSVPATTYDGSSAWTLSFANSNFPADGTYTVSAGATDRAGNTGTSATNTFAYDTAAPSSATLTSSGSFTSGTWSGAVTGTVSDSGTGGHGISSVKVSIQDSVSGTCWNGTNFTIAACPNYLSVTSGGTATGSSSANWSYTLSSSALTVGHTYTVLVQATDATTTGNTSGDLSAGTFFFATSGITFVGGTVASTTTNTNLTVPYPASAVSGDFLLLIIANSHHEAASCPSGWTSQESIVNHPGGVTTEASLVICWKFDAGESTVSVTYPGGPTNGLSARVVAYRNVNTSTPFDVADTTSAPATTGSATFPVPNLTTVTNNAKAVSVVMQNDGTNTSIPSLTLNTANGFAAEFSNGVSSSASHAAALADQSIATAGTVTFPTWASNVHPTGSNGSLWIGASLALRPITAPTVTSVSPAAGKATGGDTVTVTGTGFTGATTVGFGSNYGTSLSVTNDTSLTVTAPAGTAGNTVDVRVSNSVGTSSAVTADHFTYDTTPTVTSVSPIAGKAAGGDTVTITGTGFLSTVATTGVKFGATNAASFTVDSDTQITATTPAQAAGQVDVTVTNTSGTSSTSSADQFIFDTTPTVTSISPTSGGTGGGTSVTITGTGYLTVSGATGVKFGSTNATSYTVNSDTQITAVSPAHAAGSFDVTVTNTTGTSATTVNDIFVYGTLPAPTVTAISPNAGSSGTSVTITGTNFTAAATVKFGLTAATSVTVNGATSITATAPAGSGTADVTVTTTAGTSATSGADQFSYANVPIFQAIGTPTPYTTSGSVTVNYPSGSQIGDLLIMVACINQEDGNPFPNGFTSGGVTWTRDVDSAAIGSNGATNSMHCNAYHATEGASDTSATLTLSSGHVPTAGGEAWVIDYRKPSGAFTFTSGTGSNGTITAITPTAVNVAAAPANEIEFAVSLAATSLSLSTPGSFSQEGTTSTVTPTGGVTVSLGVADAIRAANGTPTAATWTPTGSTGAWFGVTDLVR